MKPEQINQAMDCAVQHKAWIAPSGAIVDVDNLPNYYADLNAVREAEEVLFNSGDTDMLNISYWNTLWTVCNDQHKKLTTIAHATAPQRCEALLRVWGLWKEEQV